VQHDRVVGRKKPAIVFELPHAVARNFGVGRINVHDVDLSGGERFVGEPVVEPTRGVRQCVRGLQSAPAVLSVEELLRKPESQLGMPRQIRHARDSEDLRTLLRHRNRVGVAEAERHRDAEAVRCKLTPQRLQVCRLAAIEELERERSGVLRIEVDRAVLERCKNDRGVAEPLMMSGARLP
jgi:hypothetical protein